MLQLAFTITPDLKETLDKIDTLRSNILLSLLPARVELKLQWEAQTTRIYYSFLLSRLEITKNDVVRILQGVSRKQPNDIERAVFNHKHAMDNISFEWANEHSKLVHTRTILSLAEILFTGFRTSHAVNTYRATDAPVKNLLEYLQSAHDHPVIQAGIVYSQFILLMPFGDRSEWIARILAYLFLYKNGFQLRNLLVLERYWHMTSPEYQQAFASIRKEESSTNWLHYFAIGVQNQMEAMHAEFSKQLSSSEAPNPIFYLSDRQKMILDLLDHPEARVTNTHVQKLCKVSQITASRDLARLVALSKVYSHGKGRSVYYTKA